MQSRTGTSALSALPVRFKAGEIFLFANRKSYFLSVISGYNAYLPTSGDLKSGDSLFCTTPPTPTPECQQHRHPPTPRLPVPTNCLRTLYEVLHEVYGIKMGFHHCISLHDRRFMSQAGRIKRLSCRLSLY